MIEQNKNCWLYKECNHIDCDGHCIRYYKLNYLYEEGLIPLHNRVRIKLFSDKDTKTSDKEVFKYLSEYEADINNHIEKGDNLYIHSTICGNGKTSWALRMAQTYLNNIWTTTPLTCRVLFINVPHFLLALKDSLNNKNEYAEHIKQNVYETDLVIWDDIGNKTATQFESDNLLSIIDARINNGKANIYTSNLSDSEMQQYLGDRLASRIINFSKCVELKGSDKRGIRR